MVSKVDRTVDCRDFKKKRNCCNLGRLSIFRGFAVDVSSDFSGKVEKFIRSGIKIFKNFRQSQQSTARPIRGPAKVDFFRES
jgi:hypothetical protein